jgi:adenine phosphoribosyltransferase
MDLKQVIRAIPDFPKPGILFQDITPVMEDPAAYRFALQGMETLIAEAGFNKFGAIESRGFLFGGPLALEMDKGMVLLRKAGKLPADILSVTYSLEYGDATLEVHRGSFGPGDKVILVDDLLATGGTAAASAQLVRDSGAEVAGFLFLVELDFLAGRKILQDLGPVFSLVRYS